MRGYLIGASLLLATSTAIANNTRNIRISGTMGEAVYAINEVRSIKFDTTGNMVLNLHDGSHLMWSFDEVGTMDFMQVSPAQQTAVRYIAGNVVNFANGILNVQGHAGCHVGLWDIYGQLIADGIINEIWTYNMQTLPKGIYVVRVGSETFKIMKP